MPEGSQQSANPLFQRNERQIELRYPQFLCIGAQKAGTTWLDSNLRRHPQLWLPPIKELHYFDELYLSGKNKWTEKHRLEKGTLRLQKYLEKTPEGEQNAAFLACLREVMEGPVSDEWYGRIFGRAGPAKICGEITPEYSTLPEDGVRRILRLSPQIKIVFSLRDPIERSWSQMRMMMRTKSLPGNPSFEKMALNPLLVHKSNYAATIRTWGKFVPPERFLVVFMDDIKAQPHSVLSEVFAFLGVTDRPQAFRKAEMPVHVGDKQQMPDGVRKILRKRLRPIYDDLFRIYPERVDGWMARYYGTI